MVSAPAIKAPRRSLSLVVRPVGSTCNFRCSYCYLGNEVATPLRVMDLCLARRLMVETAALSPSVHLLWHGGEPLLAGLDFFREIHAEQHRHPQTAFTNFLQSNGSTINSDTARFLADADFQVRLSLDGPAELHDRFRHAKANRGTQDRVADAIGQLIDVGISVNVSCVLTDVSIPFIDDVYRTILDAGVRYSSFLPAFCTRDGEVCPPTLSPSGYVDAYLRLFECWSADRSGMRVRELEWMISGLVGKPRGGDCTFSGQCGNVMRIEPDGAFYPCELLKGQLGATLGRFGFEPLLVLLNRARQGPVNRHLARVPASDCLGCDWYRLCHGGCTAAWSRDGDAVGDYYYCSSRKTLFTVLSDKLRTLTPLPVSRPG